MMRRVLAFAVLMLLAALPAHAADSDWSGRWDTRWRDGGARMDLVQQGSRVTGAYPSYGGRIEGEVVGRELHGRWTEGPRSGDVSFVLSADGRSFMGRFDTGEWWTGGRVQSGAREMDGLSALVTDVAHVQPNLVQVGVASITPDGIEVEVVCCLNVRSGADERADKTALMLGVLRLADRMRIWMRIRLGGDPAAASALSAVAA